MLHEIEHHATEFVWLILPEMVKKFGSNRAPFVMKHQEAKGEYKIDEDDGEPIWKSACAGQETNACLAAARTTDTAIDVLRHFAARM